MHRARPTALLLFAALSACHRDEDPQQTEGSSSGTGESGSASAADETGGDPLPPRPDTVACTFEGNAPGLLPAIALVDDGEAGVVDLAADADAARDVLLRDDLSIAVRDDDGTTLALDLSTRATRVLALALAPDHASSGQLYVRFETNAMPPRSVVSRFTLDAATKLIDPASERVVIDLADAIGERAGGALAFGPDGLLYIGVGDRDDGVSIAATDPTQRQGKLLRLDVAPLDDTGSYAIPPDNPFVGQGGSADLVWARGLRDPWRCRFAGDDPLPWCVDVGIEEQEIDHVEPGANLGWPSMDGNSCRLPAGDCSEVGAQPASATYRSVDGDCGIAGVVLASAPAELDQALLWADRCSGRVRGLDTDNDEVLIQDEILGVTESLPSAVAVDRSGAVVLVGADGIQRITVPEPAASFPVSLSDSGCFEDLVALTPAAGVVPYDLNAPLWTDGAIKSRFIVVPPQQTIDLDDDGLLVFPVGSVVLKNFAFEFSVGDASSRRSVETRVMVRRPFGWQFHSYRWNEAGTDATLLEHGETQTLSLDDHGSIESFDYDWPSRGNCKVCHGLGASNVVGLRLDQLARDHDYGHVTADQLEALAGIGLFTAALPDAVAAITEPSDEAAPLEQRARAWLHANCGHCHRPGGWTPAGLTMDLRWTTAFADTHTCGVHTQYYNAWVDGDTRIVPGQSTSSVIWERLSQRGPGQMPPLATARVDPASAVVQAWIDGLAACP
ncbi:MAG: PQQ-dependent sugar dehydrogenase [Nannocystaceae bacterium]|nr:PQQ-dependent sugar dehydrogenase [Nannocystaceae bacterium]